MSNNKRLERDLHNKVVGGVCSGLGNYFDMDPAFWRVLFFFLFLLGCSGLLIYVILWIVMPAGKGQPQVEGITDASANSELRQRNSHLAVGLTLIGLGALSLMARYIPQISWRTAWPVILIVLGIVLIIPFNNKKS